MRSPALFAVCVALAGVLLGGSPHRTALAQERPITPVSEPAAESVTQTPAVQPPVPALSDAGEQAGAKASATITVSQQDTTDTPQVRVAVPLSEEPPNLLEAVRNMIEWLAPQLLREPGVPGDTTTTPLVEPPAINVPHAALTPGSSNGAAVPTETSVPPDRGGEDTRQPVGSDGALITPAPAPTCDRAETPYPIVRRCPETEGLFDPDDTESNGVIILTPVPLPGELPQGIEEVDPADGGGLRDRGDSYAWWDWSGSIAIPDGPDGAWVGINCTAPSGLPDGSYVTQVTVHHEITHTYIGDLEVKVYNQYTSHEWMVRDNEGGSADDINETRSEYSLFDGDDPEQEWYYRVRDTYGGDEGTLDVMQLYVYYHWEEGQPDLQPYQPSGWDNKLVISNVTGTTTSASTIYDDENVYVDYCCMNSGTADAGHFRYGLYVDGILRAYVDMASLSAGYYSYVLDSNRGTLSAGWHDFMIRCDYNYEVAELNEGNNDYTRSFYITERTEPDLTPYQPGNWNDEIPVGITQLAAGDAHTYSGPYYSDETLYFNWASLNAGDATASNYTVCVQVSGTGGNTWYWDNITTSPGYYTWLSYDQPVGPLALGSHTFRLWLDYYDSVDESNESNNYYERTIVVEQRPQADLTPYQPGNWNDRIPVGITQLAGGDDHTYAGPYYGNQTLYFNWGSLNMGDVTAPNYTVHVEVTGTGGGSWNWDGLTTDPSYWTRLTNDQAVGPLSVGSHTFKLWVDYYDSVDESNESNNYYERTITVEQEPQADLTPYQAGNWDDEIPVGITQLAGADEHAYAGPYYSDQVLYFNWGSANDGEATAANYTVHFEVTGTGGDTWDWSSLTTEPGYWTRLINDEPVGPLSVGTHTFKVWLDYYGVVDESNEGNNYYERTITVEAPSQVDLAPYSPPNWNDVIPIGITQLDGADDHTYNGPYYSDQTLYFNWGCINNGEDDAENYAVYFEVTGTGGGTWDWTDITTPATYWTRLSFDASVGPLSAGDHTFRLWIDYTDVVAESNETNNYYERTITVSAERPPWLLLYYFSNGGDLEGGCESKFRAIAQAATNDNFVAYVMWDHLAGEDRVFRMTNDDDWLNGYTQGTDYWTALDIGLGGAEMDMGDPQTLNTFIDFVLGREQADHYSLIIFDHGGGVHPRENETIITGICFDQDPVSYLSVQEVGQCCSHLSTAIGRNFEFLHLDACLMQMIEVNHEVRTSCDYLVASENEGWTFIGGTSWEHNYLDDITAGTGALTLANAIASAYFDAFGGGRTISVLRQAHTANVTTAVDGLAEALINNMRTIRGSVGSARDGTQKFAYFDICHTMTVDNIFLDLYDLCRELNEHIVGMAEVNDAANAVMSAIGNEGGNFVQWEAHQTGDGPCGPGYDFTAGTFGVSIFFPQSTDPGGQPTYHNYVNTSGTPSNLAFCAATDWDEFLRAYLEWQVVKVTSSGAANVSITATMDELGHGSGTTPFWRAYDPGTGVTLTAPASSGGASFVRWTRNGATYSTNQSISFTVNDDYDFEVVYEASTYELTVEGSPAGGGTTSPSGTDTYDYGEWVDILAIPYADYDFDHWEGDVEDPFSASTRVYMDGDKTVTAVFEPECLGDVNGDGECNLSDLAELLAHYGMTSGATYGEGDLDGDGDVDVSDLATLLAVYGTNCP